MDGPMISRYSRPELAALWSDEARMAAWRDVEVAACEAMEGPTAAELDAIRAATFTVEAVDERERTTDHDVAAFVDVLSESAGPAGRWIHYGLTSSDVLDTALALQLKRAGEIVVPGAHRLVQALAARAREQKDTLCVGRTHGVHAEPTSFGIKLAGFAFEAHRNAQRLERAFAQASVGAISGAVGTYSATSPEFESQVLASLGLEREPVSTQVVARDRHAELLQAIALAGAGLERFATELRHLQRTEVREAEEPFRAGQKGSSAMPHKRNPIKSEQLSGLARVLRGNAQAAVEDVALWHERDISHSSVERVILPDSTILIDYMQARATALVEGMVVHRGRMAENLEITCGALFSQRVLLALIEQAGMVRDEAYRIVQRTAQEAWDTRTPLRELLASEPAAAGLDLDALFDYGVYVRHAGEIFARLDEISGA
jgi:adenylosuccinate lyase